jgi:NAD(P)-dependent dehydrogenase (short-subunit alcohol dehydrogenase family)
MSSWNIKEKTVLVTGATDGIGRETAIRLVQEGCRVVIHGRNPAKTESLHDALATRAASPLPDFVLADFTSLDEIWLLSKALHEKYSALDVLINNAGVFRHRYRKTGDGFEVTWQVNYLAPFALTLLLLDMLQKPASSRVVNVVSQAHAVRLDWRDLNSEESFEGYNAYAWSKLALIMFSLELADRLKETGVSVISLHPGVIRTKLLSASSSSWGLPPSRGAENVIEAAADPSLSGKTGLYLVERKPVRPPRFAEDGENRKKLWSLSVEMTGLNIKQGTKEGSE